VFCLCGHFLFVYDSVVLLRVGVEGGWGGGGIY